MHNSNERYAPKDSVKAEQWEYAWDHYTGEYATHPKITDYLHRKEQRETNQAYEERQDLSDPILYFPECVESLNGIVSHNKDNVNREWGELGDPDVVDSTAYKLYNNADGNGMNWEPLFKQVGIRQTVMHTVWGLVDGVTEDKEGNVISEASIKVINPQSVVDYFPENGPLLEVLVKEEIDDRSGIRDVESDKNQNTYILFEIGGWTRFKVEEYEDKNGEMQTREVVIGEGEYQFWHDKDRKIPALPIYNVEIPMPRFVGYQLAKKQNHIFNQKSLRDFAIGNTSFSLLVLSATKEQYTDFLSDIEKGFNVLREDPDQTGTHHYMSPDSGYLSEYGKILEDNKKDFYDAAFKQYGDAAKQVTATEIRLESRSGIEAFLSLLVTSIDEFENYALWRLTQVYFPDNASAWGSARVERSKDFKPKDVEEAFNKISAGILNADRAKAISTYQKVKELHPEWSEEEIAEEVQRIRDDSGAVEVPSNMLGG